MKYIGRVFIWALAFGVAFQVASANRIQADPTDDFSFSLGQDVLDMQQYQLMNTSRVEEILSDNLDLFPKSQVPKLASHLVALCHRYRFDPAFILSLIQVESGFKVKATSGVGALGLMQLMPATANQIAREWMTMYSDRPEPRLGLGAGRKAVSPRALMDPFMNITIGVAYLAWLRDHYRGHSPYYLVAAYNIGPARLDELRTRKGFRPTGTKIYYEKIRRGVPNLRFYRREENAITGLGNRNGV